MNCKKSIKNFSYNTKDFPDQYPDEVINAISLIGSDINNIKIMGSYRLKSSLWASDIDGFEIIPIEQQYDAIRNIVSRITTQPNYGRHLIIGDIKIGLNKYKELLQYIGNIDKFGKVSGYNLNALKNVVKDTYVEEIAKAPIHPTPEEWLVLYKFVSSFTALRWTPEEILKGFKDKYELRASIMTSPVTKIDIYIQIYGRMTEVTNIILPHLKDINFFINQIQTGLTFNMVEQNYLKSLKNMFAIARLTQDCKKMEQLENIILSPTNMLNSCVNDLKIIKDMISFNYDFDINKSELNNHINTIIIKLSHYYDNDLDSNIYNMIKNLVNNLKELDYIIEYLSQIVKKHTLKYIKTNNITFKGYILF